MNEMNPSPGARGAGGRLAPNMKIDDLALKKMAGEAISRVDGVLGMDGSFTDFLKTGDELVLGISVSGADGGQGIQLSTKIITEYGKNIPTIVGEVQRRVTDALHGMTGLNVEKVTVEVTDTMTREDYRAKNGEPYSPN